MHRCSWANHELLATYHDAEWGVPVHDDRVLFEFLVLEGAQAGLSWLAILQRREGYRQAFAGFDPAAVARFTPEDVERLMHDPGIIRNRLKIASAITNARAFLKVQAEFGSFDTYLWRFVDGKPVQGHRNSIAEVPASTPLSDALSKDMKKRGFTFVGTTICYAYMQAVGLVNDHVVDCFRYRELSRQV
jgi:DNA-3-methyladenine glycosylase I